MMAESEKRTDAALEEFFEALCETPEEASPDLLARVLADAYAAQDALAPEPAPSAPVAATAAPARRGLLRGLLDSIGGWPAAAGLATATLAGVWIGYNPPSVVDELTLAFMNSSYSAELGAALPSYADLSADG